MAGTRLILFGIAVILASGFTLVHDQLRYGWEYGPNTGLAQIGLLTGLLVCFVGLLVGTFATQSESAE